MNEFMRFFAALMSVVFTMETLVGPQTTYAQSVSGLPAASQLIALTPQYTPLMVQGLKIHPGDGLNLSFILDSGNTDLNDQQLKDESEKLIKYFLTSLTVPENDLWVNLSPFESDRISSAALEKTEMGRDLLAQDYLLKKITSSLMYPEGETGKDFWNKFYQKAYEVYGATDIPVEAFHKVWIMPDTAEVFAQGDSVVILKSSMKVMLEEDYYAEEKGKQIENSTSADMKQVLKDVLIPVITEEVNHGETFANLRQIYHALILAKWFKSNLQESILGKVYADQNKTGGIESVNQGEIAEIYQKYLDAFKAGSQGYLKEDYDVEQVFRFSFGTQF